MDSSQSVRAALTALNNQTCLTALANAGEYKRALKLLDESAQITFSDGKFVVAIGGETVTLGAESDTFSCTCPSPVICRHILAAVMAVCAAAPDTDGADDSDETTEAEKTPNATVFETFDKDDVRKLVGDRIFRSAVKRYAASQIEIISQDPLSALVNGHKTVFPSGWSKGSVCSCKSSMCEHRALALLKMYSQRTGESLAADTEPPDERILNMIENCLEHLSGLLERGLYSATAVDGQLLMFYSLNLSKYSNALGRNLRSLSLLVDEVLENKIFTENGRLTYHFCKAYNILSAVALNADKPDVLARILEDDTKSYRVVPKGEFLSLGYYPFLTESGYAGVTHMLAGDEGVVSLSSVLPTVYNDNSDDNLVETVKRQRSEIFTSLAGHKIVLNNFKNNGSRISVSESTIVIDGGIAIDDIPSSDIYEFDYGALAKTAYANDYFGARSTRYAVVPYDTMTAVLNDRGVVETELEFGNRSLIAELDLNPVTRSACELLLEKDRKNGFAVLEMYDSEYLLRTLFEKGEKVSLYFPDEDAKKRGKKR